MNVMLPSPDIQERGLVLEAVVERKTMSERDLRTVVDAGDLEA